MRDEIHFNVMLQSLAAQAPGLQAEYSYIASRAQGDQDYIHDLHGHLSKEFPPFSPGQNLKDDW